MVWVLFLFILFSYITGTIIDSVLTQTWGGQILADLGSAFTTWPTWKWGLMGIMPYVYPVEPVEAFLGVITWNFSFFQGAVGSLVRTFYTALAGVALVMIAFKIWGRE